MRSLDVAVIVAYFAAVIVGGLVLAGRQRNASDYFLGHRGLPWWALMMSVVATETSALTVISIPGIAARGDLTWLQVTFGYLVGRIGVAYFLLPGYFDGSQDTAYQRLERRFGVAARRTASGVFLFTRSIADGVRMFATAITLAIITHWSMSLGILAIGLVTLLYTWVGGLRAVVGSHARNRTSICATVARGARLEGRAARADRIWRVHHRPNRLVPIGRDEPMARRGGPTRHAKRRHLPNLHRDTPPHRNRGAGGRRHSGRGDEQSRVGRELPCVRRDARFLRT